MPHSPTGRIDAAMDAYVDALDMEADDRSWAVAVRAATTELVVAVAAYLLEAGWEEDPEGPPAGRVVADPAGLIMLHGAFTASDGHPSAAEVLGIAAWANLESLPG